MLTDEQKSQIIASRKAEAGQDLHQKTVEKYEEAVERFSKQAHKHTAKLRADLFNVGDGGSAALSQAVAADEEQLIRMIELADLAGDHTIARAAFAAGVVQGDAPKAVQRYLDSNPRPRPSFASNSRRQNPSGSRQPGRTSRACSSRPPKTSFAPTPGAPPDSRHER